MKITKAFSITLLTAFTMLIVTSQVEAGTGSYGQYGQYTSATPSQGITIDKMVGRNTTTKGGTIQYVDNMSPNDPRFTPGQQVVFQLKVRNNTNAVIKNVTVKDIVPQYVEPVEGPGNYDANTRTVTYTYAQLNAGEERVERLVMQVVPQDRLPSDKGLMCVTNKGQVNSGSMNDDDTAQFCIEKEVVGVQKAPSAGPEMGIAMMGLYLAGAGAGIYLKKRA